MQTILHYREQLAYLQTSPQRYYGPPPPLFGLIALPLAGQRLFLAAGAVFITSLTLVALGMAVPIFLSTALLSSFFYFPAVLNHAIIRRKANLIPLVLAILIISPGDPFPSVRLAIALVYLSAGIEKLRFSGLRWADGRSMQTYLLENYFYNERPPALWLARHPRLCRLISIVVLLWELSFWMVLPFPKLAWIYAPLGLALHAGISATMRIHYWIYFCPAYWIFAAPWIAKLFSRG